MAASAAVIRSVMFWFFSMYALILGPVCVGFCLAPPLMYSLKPVEYQMINWPQIFVAVVYFFLFVMTNIGLVTILMPFTGKIVCQWRRSGSDNSDFAAASIAFLSCCCELILS